MQFKKISTEFLKFSHEDEQYIKQQIKKNMPGVMKSLSGETTQEINNASKIPLKKTNTIASQNDASFNLDNQNKDLEKQNIQISEDPNSQLQLNANVNPLDKTAYLSETNKFVKKNRRLILPKNQSNNFSQFGMWYREDRRLNPHIKYVHELQNQYYDMTKVHLTKD